MTTPILVALFAVVLAVVVVFAVVWTALVNVINQVLDTLDHDQWEV